MHSAESHVKHRYSWQERGGTHEIDVNQHESQEAERRGRTAAAARTPRPSRQKVHRRILQLAEYHVRTVMSMWHVFSNQIYGKYRDYTSTGRFALRGCTLHAVSTLVKYHATNTAPMIYLSVRLLNRLLSSVDKVYRYAVSKSKAMKFTKSIPCFPSHLCTYNFENDR